MKKLTTLLLICILATLTVNAQSTKVLMKTSMGDITLMLYDDTPMHKENFIELVNKKFYDGILFHRLKSGFMIQAGDPGYKTNDKGDRIPGLKADHKIPAEIRKNHIHKKGALAAARMPDNINPRKESSGSQFYIVHGEKWSSAQLDYYEKNGDFKYTEEQRKIHSEIGGYAPLDYEYTVYGEVIKGLDVVDKIANVKRDEALRPLEKVKIISVRIIK